MVLTDVDRQILDGCLNRDPDAWRRFVERFTGLFVHVIQHTADARSVRLSPVDVEDVCAQILLTLVRDDFAVLRRFRRKASLATYLTVIARRVAVRELAKRKLQEELGHLDARTVPVHEVASASKTPERIADQDQVEQLLRQLNEREAAIVRAYHLEGKSYREISEELGVPENSIGPTLYRAREKLRTAVSSDTSE